MRLPMIIPIAVAGVLAVAAPANAATVQIDTLSGWDGTGYAANLEPRYGSTVYAQTITAPLGGPSALTHVEVAVQGRSGLEFRGEVRRWDGDRSIGPALWVSDPRAVCECPEFVEHQFDPTGVEVDPGEQVVFMLTALRDGSTGGFARIALRSSDPEPGGKFWRANPLSLAEVEAEPWIATGEDLDVAYRATFSAPDVDPIPLPERPDPSVGQGAPPAPPIVADAPSEQPPEPPAPAPEVGAPAVADLPVVSGGQTPAQQQTARPCTVPQLQGKRLEKARRALARQGCALGAVKGSGRRVARQGARPGRTLDRGAAVSVTLR